MRTPDRKSLTARACSLQSGSGGHVGERVQRLGDRHYLPPEQPTADSGGPPHQADGQRVRLHDLHLRGRVHV